MTQCRTRHSLLFPAYMGPFGWLGLDFMARKKVDWDEVRELIDASFRMIAPKKLIKQLDGVPGAAGHESIGAL